MLKRFTSLTLSTLVLLASPGPSWLWAAEAVGATLNGVEVGPDEVTLHLSQQVKYNTFFTSDPPRLVVELLNTEYVPETKTLDGKGQFLKKVRSGQYQKEPTMISRIVLDLFKLVGYQARWEDRSLIIHLQGIGATGKAPPAPAAKTAPKEAAKTAAAAAAGAAAGAAAAKAPAQAPEKPAPPPAAAPAAKPAPAAAKAPEKPAPPPATASAKAVEKPAPAPAAAAKSPEKPAASAAKAPEKPLPLPAVEKESSSSGYSKEVAVMAEDEPEALKDSGVKPAATKPAKPSAKPSVPVGFSSELADMAMDAAPEGEAEQAKVSASSVFSGASRLRRDILSSLSNELKSVDYENVDVRDVIKHLASEAKVNIIYGSDVSGPVTLHLTEVPFSEIFMTVLRIHGLVADQVGENILRIATPNTLKSESSVAIPQTRVIRLKYTMASDIKSAVDAVYKAEKRNGAIIDDKVTNSLIVTDTLDGIASIERLLAKLDVRPQQVMIEAKLIEVKLTNEVHFGIQWDYLELDRGKALGKQGQTVIGAPAAGSAAQPYDSTALTLTAPGVGGTGRGTGVFLPSKQAVGAFTFGRVTNNYWLSATLTAAASQGKVKVLSDPKIATLNGKKAQINITTAIPYTTSNVASTGVTSQQVGTTTTGIKLEVTPTINADGRITLEVNPNISQPSANVTSAVAGVPAVDTREAKTTVLVHDGETIVIGGLITDSVANGVTKVPFLGDIPLLGWFFKKKSVERTRVELLIFVTTRVLPS